MNGPFKDDGVLMFSVAEGSGKGSSLQGFLDKYEHELGSSVKRLNPIAVPKSKDFYGHISFDCDYLEKEEMSLFLEIVTNPVKYSVSPENCCISALNELGVEGLLDHFFHQQLPAHSKNPAQFKRFQSIKTLKKRAARIKMKYMKLNRKVQSLPSATEKGSEMAELLASPKYYEKELATVQTCSCWQCVYSDEVLQACVEEGETEECQLKPASLATAMYYRGKGFFYASGINVEAINKNMISEHFSLSYLNALSITSLLDDHYPGVNSPFVYFGDAHSFFPIHVEDLSLFSLNYLHHGYPKLWIIVPPTSIAKLHYFLSKEFTCFQHGSCIGLLGHKYHMPTPTWLARNGIPFKVVIQRCGQGIIVTPNAAHFGFNLGPNIAEASNFGTMSWIPYGMVYPTCTCMMGQVHADLGAIVQGFRPSLLNAYLHRKIPKVQDDPQFSRSVIYNGLWKEAYDDAEEDSPGVDDNEGPTAAADADNYNDGPAAAADDDDNEEAQAEDEGAVCGAVKAQCCRKRPNRKLIMCPVCDATYKGGHKQRLLHHIETAHPNLCAEEQTQVDAVVCGMFPVRGCKLPKKICEKCGKAVARSLKAHEQSSACKPELSSI